MMYIRTTFESFEYKSSVILFETKILTFLEDHFNFKGSKKIKTLTRKFKIVALRNNTTVINFLSIIV